MQPSQSSPRSLLTAREVQELLHIDRSTVYRMAEDGRLPAIRVGRSWRFPADRITALLTSDDTDTDPQTAVLPAADRLRDTTVDPTPALSLVTRTDAGNWSATSQGVDHPARPASPPLAEPAALNTDAAQAVVEVSADLLGVMMVVTDMHGQPLTEVANQCTWFATHAEDPGVLDSCIREWRDLADHPDLSPRFQPGAHGFECARAFVRHGSTLVGMVLAGGVSPTNDPTVDPDLHHLDAAQRQRVLSSLPRIAAAISTTPPRSAAETHDAPQSVAPTKEN